MCDDAIPSVSLGAGIAPLASKFLGAVPGRGLCVAPGSGVPPPSAWKPPQELGEASPPGTAMPFGFYQSRISTSALNNSTTFGMEALSWAGVCAETTNIADYRSISFDRGQERRTSRDGYHKAVWQEQTWVIREGVLGRERKRGHSSK